jgi:hypothetical protein
MMRSRAHLARQHLMLRMRPINRLLRAAVLRQSEALARLPRPDLNELCVTPDYAEALLDDADRSVADGAGELRLASPSPDEAAAEAELRAHAAAAGLRLPLDALTADLDLSPLELEAVLLCTAAELDRAYERIFAYVVDDLQRRGPSVEILVSLSASSAAERLARRAVLGRFGRLRRVGLLRAVGDAAADWRQELRLGAGAFELLLGEGAPAPFRDPASVEIPDDDWLPAEVDARHVERLGRALGAGALAAVGVWGRPADGQEQVVWALARAVGRPLRRLAPASDAAGDPEATVRWALDAAAATGALLWITVDDLAAPSHERTRAALAARLPDAAGPICLSGTFPWHPASLLAARPYAEMRLPAVSFASRAALWRRHLPELADDALADRAARLRVGPAEVCAIARVARAAAVVAAPADGAPDLDARVEAASAVVIRKRIDHVARVIEPQRGPADLILQPDLHRQVIEVAQFFRAWPRVAAEWRLGAAFASSRGVKALFTGDPGTGKTLAAEVIAGVVGMPLFKVDLAQVVSKWVGETEKNLECIFREAEQGSAVLFFDEAEALFGRRGEVQHGTDRYANLEVSYLLQKLEDFDGLVILASNLKDQIDAAFTRRFHVLLHFPRPGDAERLQIWRAALAATPLAADVGADLPMLARLDLTGAGIVGAVRTAALLAAGADAPRIEMAHVIEGVARQYRREARVLTPGDLGQRRELRAGVG